ncbi:MAG: DUF6441 family protein [Rhodospirillaceae bacterium]
MRTTSFFRLAIEGNLQDIYAAEQEIIAKATTAGINQAAGYTLNDFRRQTRRAGLGAGLEKAWQRKNYPGRGYSMRPAALVYSKSKRIHGAFAEGRTIVGPVLIPTAFAEEQGLAVDAAKGRGAVARRWFNLQLAEEKFGPLWTQVSAFGTVLLMGKARFGFAQQTRAQAIFSAHSFSARTARGGQPVALATVHRVVRLKRLLDLEGPPQKYNSQIPQYIVGAVNRAERPKKPRLRVAVGI